MTHDKIGLELLKPSYMFGTPDFKWDKNTIAWKYNPTGQPAHFSTEAVLQGLQSAAARWEAVCGIKFQYSGLTADSFNNASCDGKTVVGGAPLSGSTIGTAQVCYRSGRVLNELDLALDNQSPLQISNLQIIIQTATHEMGHGLGLGHSDSSAAIMYPTLRSDTLTADDISGCQAIYGPPSATGNESPQPTPPITPTPSPTPVVEATPTPAVISGCGSWTSKFKCEIFNRVNSERLRNGLGALKVLNQCMNEAKFHASEMAATAVLTFDSPSENFESRMIRFGLGGSYFAENISKQPSASEVVTNWLNDRKQRAKILSNRYRSTGVSVSYSKAGVPFAVQCYSGK